MQHFKNFTITAELAPVQQELSESCSVQFIHDVAGIDWYSLQRLFQPNTLKIQYDSTGVIIAADTDASKLFPRDCSVIEMDKTSIPEDFQPGAFIYRDGVVTAAPVNYVAVATAERNKRMAAATARINQLTEAQEDGDITDAELAELSALREIRIKLRRIDLTTAPDIDWP